MTLEAFLLCWMSRYILPRRPKDGINSYVFPLAIRLVKGIKLPLRPLMYAGLDDSENIPHSMGRYNVVTYTNNSFFQIFL